MSLKAKFSDQFKPQIRDRGHAYFRSGFVEILEHSESHVQARVKGSDKYLVRLTLNRSSLRVACTCPYFDEGETCKHIWATLLAADSRQYLTKIDSMPALPLIFDDDALIELLDNDSEQSQTNAVPSKVAEPTPLWQHRLALLANTVEADTSKLSSAWLDRREIFYVIDPDTSATIGQLSIEIGYRERKIKGDWGKIKSQRIPKSIVPRLKDATDREILAILSGSTGGYFPNYDYNYDSIATRFSISTALQPLLVPLMCATGRCVVRSRDKTVDVLTVQWDDGLPWCFWLAVDLDEPKGEYVIRAELRRGGERMAIASPILMTEAILVSRDLRASNFASAGARLWRSYSSRH